MQEYEVLAKQEGCHPDVACNLACCYFMLGMYAEADAATEKGREAVFLFWVVRYIAVSLQLRRAICVTDCSSTSLTRLVASCCFCGQSDRGFPPVVQ